MGDFYRLRLVLGRFEASVCLASSFLSNENVEYWNRPNLVRNRFFYFVADLGLVLAYLYIERAPLGSFMPKGFPFWYIASDTIVLVFLVHLSFLCIDHTVYVQLDSIGLSFAYLIFLIAASCWAVIAGFKYLSIRKLYLRES